MEHGQNGVAVILTTIGVTGFCSWVGYGSAAMAGVDSFDLLAVGLSRKR